MKTFLKSAIVVSLLALNGITYAQSSGNDTLRFTHKISGQWKSIACELRPQMGQDGKVQSWYLTRIINIHGNKLDAVFVSYADEACEAPLWKLEFGATARYAGDWTGLKGAKKVDLAVDRYSHVTPLTQGFADFLNSAGEESCGGTKADLGKALDVKQYGCKAFGLPPNNTVKEAEIMATMNGMLFFAARPVDGSRPSDDSKRINALQIPMIRVK